MWTPAISPGRYRAGPGELVFFGVARPRLVRLPVGGFVGLLPGIIRRLAGVSVLGGVFHGAIMGERHPPFLGERATDRPGRAFEGMQRIAILAFMLTAAVMLARSVEDGGVHTAGHREPERTTVGQGR